MKFAMVPQAWEQTITELAEAGHEHVSDLVEADFLVYTGGQLPRPLPANIKWIQFVFAGVDRLIDAGVMENSGVRWANAAGVYGKPVAEIAMSLLLAQLHQHKVATLAGSFDVRWDMDARQGWLFQDKTVAIIGAGGIAQELIPMLRPFGVKVTAVNRSGNEVEGADETFPITEADHVWGEADAFVLLMPLTEDTRGMVNRDIFTKMKSSAVVVNVGRGPLIDHDDLVEALRQGQIAGAAMDVTDPEPLPENHPLWGLDNCLITPHIAATGRIAQQMVAPQIIANAAAFEAGERMPTEVDVAAGY